MRVKCLAQEHNAVPRSGLEPRPPDPESSALTIRPPRLPYIMYTWLKEQDITISIASKCEHVFKKMGNCMFSCQNSKFKGMFDKIFHKQSQK